MRALRAVAALAAALWLGGCAASARGPSAHAPQAAAIAPVADSVTIGLWHFDENGGTRAADAGPFRLDAVAGLDSRTDFGRFRSARVFRHAIDSFARVPYNPELEAPSGFTVEAWVYLDSLSQYEMSVIAARWTPVPNQQGWVFGVSGLNRAAPAIPLTSPGWFQSFRGLTPPQHLVFGYQPLLAGGVLGFASTAELPMQRWVHVAASVDGEVVRLYLGGTLDAQFTTTGPIRPCEAPLEIGNAFDPRQLTAFGGDLRMDPNIVSTTFYNFTGSVDELRLSNSARKRFESAP